MSNEFARISLRMDSLERGMEEIQRYLGLPQSRFEPGPPPDTLRSQFEELNEGMNQLKQELKVYMELAVGKRITTLFDQHAQAQERAAEQRLNEQHTRRLLDEIQARLAALENRRS